MQRGRGRRVGEGEGIPGGVIFFQIVISDWINIHIPSFYVNMYRVIANLSTIFLGSICPPNHTKEINLT